MSMTGRQFELAAGEHEATVVEVGAALRRYARAGRDVTAPFDEHQLPPRCCGAVLVPWPNRLRGGRYRFDGVEQQLALSEPARGNAIHGLGRWARWTPTRHEASRVTLALDIVPQKGYPFEVLVAVTYELHAELGLSVSITATNHGAARAPFGAGFHPYLSTHGAGLDEVTIRLPARERLLLDDAQLPVGVHPVAGTEHDLRRGRPLGQLRMDDGFTGLDFSDGRATAEVRVGDAGARLWFDEAFPYLQLFNPDDLADGRPAVAIEPMSCASDAYNSGAGLVVLEPGGHWSGSWGITPL